MLRTNRAQVLRYLNALRLERVGYIFGGEHAQTTLVGRTEREDVPAHALVVLRAEEMRLDEHGQPTKRRRLGEATHLGDDLGVEDAMAT